MQKKQRSCPRQSLPRITTYLYLASQSMEIALLDKVDGLVKNVFGAANPLG